MVLVAWFRDTISSPFFFALLAERQTRHFSQQPAVIKTSTPTWIQLSTVVT